MNIFYSDVSRKHYFHKKIDRVKIASWYLPTTKLQGWRVKRSSQGRPLRAKSLQSGQETAQSNSWTGSGSLVSQSSTQLRSCIYRPVKTHLTSNFPLKSVVKINRR